MIHIDFGNIDLSPEQCVSGFGTTLIVAPHADDESLGCGGLISLLTKYGKIVYILLLSDGTLSHPNSREYPADRLMKLRESEIQKAAAVLGVPEDHIIFSRYKDRSVPILGEDKFQKAVSKISEIIQVINPENIFVPWRRDPHPDHRAAYQLIKAADKNNAKIYEYPIWLQELGDAADAPILEEATPFKLDITSVLEQKQNAIAAHISQTTDLISDDPKGFMLSKEMLDQFKIPFEIFFISK